jgi:hypothetical protein
LLKLLIIDLAMSCQVWGICCWIPSLSTPPLSLAYSPVAECPCGLDAFTISL